MLHSQIRLLYKLNDCLLGLGIMPLQLLNLGVIIPRLFYRMFLTRTPRGKCINTSMLT